MKAGSRPEDIAEAVAKRDVAAAGLAEAKARLINVRSRAGRRCVNNLHARPVSSAPPSSHTATIDPRPAALMNRAIHARKITPYFAKCRGARRYQRGPQWQAQTGKANDEKRGRSRPRSGCDRRE